MMQQNGNEMMLINALSILFLTHVGRAAKVRKQPASLRSDPGPHHRNRRPTSPEYAACKGAGHQQAIAPFDIGCNGQHRAGKNDPRKDRAIGWRKDDNRFKL
jgi:hypothetical protein